jgi:hypothetical protein
VRYFIPIMLATFGLIGFERCPAEDLSPFPEGFRVSSSPDPNLEAASVTSALEQYLKEVDDIEANAARQKAEARARLLQRLQPQAQSPVPVPESFPGLVGGPTVDGAASGFVFEYTHGTMFDRQIVWDRFHDGEVGPFPSVVITLQGYIVVPQDMTVIIRQAGGGVNQDHAELFINDQSIGVVGDDTVKKAVYVVHQPQGTHRVRWVLTAGTFQHCLLKFEDPQSGELLPMYHTPADRDACGYAQAREVVPVNADPAAWPLIDDPKEWRWVPIAGR